MTLLAGSAARRQDPVYYEFQVEFKAKPTKDSPAPEYPAALKNINLSGEVLASFVVDTLGRADSSTVQVLRSSNPMFISAVRAALPRLRYEPARIGTRKVKQLVQQLFPFKPE